MRILIALLMTVSVWAQVDEAKGLPASFLALDNTISESRVIAKRINEKILAYYNENGDAQNYFVGALAIGTGANFLAHMKYRAWDDVSKKFNKTYKASGGLAAMRELKEDIEGSKSEYKKKVISEYQQKARTGKIHKANNMAKAKYATNLWYSVSSMAVLVGSNLYYFLDDVVEREDVMRIERIYDVNNFSKNGPLCLQFTNMALLDMSEADLAVARQIELEHIVLNFIEESIQTDPSFLKKLLSNSKGPSRTNSY